MNEGFNIGDIIILAAVAAFIILRYRSMLGDKTGRDPSDIAKSAAPRTEDVERIIQLPQKAEALKPAVPTVTFDAYSVDVRDALRDMHKIDADFTADGFIEGAKSAFEMIIEAYREGDHATLKMLLDAPLYERFAGALKEQEAKGEKAESTLLAITKADIIAAELKGSKATITVQFTSDQVQLTKDKNGAIIDGDASEEFEIDDTWRFARDLKSSDPNWVIIET